MEYSNDKIRIQCGGCANLVERPRYEIYSGHWHSDGMEYKCELCGGTMHDVTHRENATCAGDIALRDMNSDFMAPANLVPWKVWKQGDF